MSSVRAIVGKCSGGTSATSTDSSELGEWDRLFTSVGLDRCKE